MHFIYGVLSLQSTESQRILNWYKSQISVLAIFHLTSNCDFINWLFFLVNLDIRWDAPFLSDIFYMSPHDGGSDNGYVVITAVMESRKHDAMIPKKKIQLIL